MRSSSLALGLLVGLAGGSLPAHAQTHGFALERLAQAAPGTGGLLTDDLRQAGDLGGAAGFSLGYAYRPLRAQGVDLVSSEALADLAVTVSYARFRFFASVASPLYLRGQSGAVNGVELVPPDVTLENHPDSLADARLGLSARLVGDAASAFRLGADAQLFLPTGAREDFQSDGTVRGLVRVLVAGNAGAIDWAGALGVHLRSLSDAAVPDGPRGSELQLSASAGVRLAAAGHEGALRLGPELFAVTALGSAFAPEATGLEALLAARFEGRRRDGVRYRLKLGAGFGLVPAFGVPEWRVLGGVELRGGEP